jgi:hypothetical protein
VFFACLLLFFPLSYPTAATCPTHPTALVFRGFRPDVANGDGFSALQRRLEGSLCVERAPMMLCDLQPAPHPTCICKICEGLGRYDVVLLETF